MSPITAYPANHTEAVAAHQETTQRYMRIAGALARIQSSVEKPLSISDLISQTVEELSVSRDEVGMVYWELARKGYFDINGNPTFSLPDHQ